MFHLVMWLKPNFLLELKLSHMIREDNISLFGFTTSSLVKEPFTNCYVLPPLNKIAWLKENTVIFQTQFVLFFIPLSLGEAVLTAGCLINRHSSTVLFEQPLKLFSIRETILFALGPFGCTWFVLLPPHECSKLAPKPTICVPFLVMKLNKNIFVISILKSVIFVSPAM